MTDTIFLPEQIGIRLEALAARTGRTVADCVREAITRYLDDWEDLLLAEAVAERIRAGDEETLSLDEVEALIWKAEERDEEDRTRD